MRALLTVSLFLTLSACASAAQTRQAPRTARQLQEAIDQVLDRAAFENATWGVLVMDLEQDEVLYRRNPRQSFIPASITKLYTTAAALDLLGPDYRYRTPLYTDGDVVDGVLRGNLIVRGSGDPVIGGRFNDGDLTEAFRNWADALLAAGIHRIEGDIIGDDDVFDDLPLGYGWSWDDEPYWYSAEISALSFNDNCVDFSITGQGAGQAATIAWEPMQTDFVTVRNATYTLPADSSLIEGYARERGSNAFNLYSRVPAGRVDRESLSVRNPTLYFVHVLRAALVEAGLSISGRAVDADDLSIKPAYDGSLRQVALHTSPPLSDIVRVINKRSQNLYAEQVLKTLAAERPVMDDDLTPGSAEMGVAAAMRTFARARIDTSRIQLVDGSGLSRMNLVTPEMTAGLLHYFWHHPAAEVRTAFLESLPIGGVDGSLQGRFTSGPGQGNVRAKTGTVSNASTLSGYVNSGAGTPLIFVIMGNHYTVPTSEVRAAQDEVVTLLARYPR
jgi:D-alanyl-D-alanine carboxypeptidase/D-alanyl-D-alanine-endopeptidase (penicillin-binding protein 4)